MRGAGGTQKLPEKSLMPVRKAALKSKQREKKVKKRITVFLVFIVSGRIVRRIQIIVKS